MNFKDKLADPARMITGHVAVIPSAVTAQAMSVSGADFLVFDREHGPVGPESLHAMIAATQGTGCAPLVRIPSIDENEVKRALDAGAEGSCFPLARSVADAERAVASLRYPPHGTRGWGPFVAHSRWNTGLFDYLPGPGTKTVCMLLIETIGALENIEDICAVEGVDCMVLAPFDLSTELGVPGQLDHPLMTEANARIEAAAKKAGMPLGGVAFTEEQAQDLKAKGYRILANFDVLMLKRATAQVAEWARA